MNMYKIVSLFPFLLMISSGLSIYRPELFTWFSEKLIPIGLGFIMLGMGLTLKIDDFARIAKYPKSVFAGILLQYTIMPASGWAIGKYFGLSPEFATGIILVSCCPGGTASNVITYIARADVALSVTLTTISTFLAIILTPFLTANLVGNRLEVNAFGLFMSTIKVILLPLIVGVGLNHFLPAISKRISESSPILAVLFIILIVSSIIGASKTAILESKYILLVSVFSLHISGFFWGYIFGRFLKLDKITCRTISIEVGMQNSGLGVVLARENFLNPMVAVPSAISSLAHSLIASFLAAIWRMNALEKDCASQKEF